MKCLDLFGNLFLLFLSVLPKRLSLFERRFLHELLQLGFHDLRPVYELIY